MVSRLFRFALASIILFVGFSTTSALYAADDPLILGMFPRRNQEVSQKLFTPLAKYLSQKLGREVRLETSKNFADFWKRVNKQKYDIVHYNQYHYVKTHKEKGYEVIMKNEELGESTITASIIVRKDSGINSLSDLKGKTIRFGGGPKAMQSYIFASFLLRSEGLNKKDYKETFAKNPPAAIKAVYNKEADAAGAGEKILLLPVVTKKINTKELKYLASGTQHAHLPWAVKKGMKPALKKQIKQLLAGLKDTKEGKKILRSAKLTGLVPARDDDYNPHRDIIKDVLGEDYY